MSENDYERLASRLAMLAGEEGEAANAGRAAASLLRRLGLSGGELKAIFLAGAASLGHRPGGGNAGGEVERLQGEVAGLRHALFAAEAAAQRAERERDVLRNANTALQRALLDSRSVGRIWRGAAVIAAAGILLVLVVVYALAPGPQVPPAGEAALPRAGPAHYRVAVVRLSGTPLYAQPDRDGPVLVRLAAGSPLPLRRTFWHSLMPWAEVEEAGRIGYVLGNDVDLR